MSKISVAKFLGKPEDEVEALDEAATLKLFTDKTKEIATIAHASGEGRAFKKVRTLLKSTIGVESEDDDLIEDIIDKVKGKIPKDSEKKEVTDDDVKNHGLYLNLNKELVKAKTDFETLSLEKKVKETKEKLIEEFDGLLATDFKQPANKLASNKLKSLFLDEMAKITEKNGKYFQNGVVLEDDLHNPLSKPDIAKMIASQFFDVKTAEDSKDDTDSPEKDKSKGGSPKSLTPKTNEEINAILESADFTDIEKDSAFNFFNNNKPK